MTEMTEWMESNPASPFPSDGRTVVCFAGRHPSTRVKGPIGTVEPQAFLVRLGADSGTLRVHFHPVDQFQFVVRGEGRLGGHEVGPGTVHYADRYQPYGPIEPGDDGIAFLTLRGVSDAGAHFMPESQSRLALALRTQAEPVRRRNISVDLEAPVSEGEAWHDIGGSHGDGLAMRLAVVPEGARAKAVQVGGTGGFLVVVGGSVRAGSSLLRAGSLRWCPAGAMIERLAPGVGGARLAWLQLPARGSVPAAAACA